MEYDQTATPEEAARLLAKELRHEPWLTAVGSGLRRGKAALYVYVKSPLKAARSKLLDRKWMGYDVHVKLLNARPAKRKAIAKPAKVADRRTRV